MQHAQNTVIDKRFVMVLGKGGTGKTTTCAALAVAAAKEKKKVLIALCNQHDHLSAIFGAPRLDSEIRNLRPGIDAVNMNPSASLAEYGRLVIKIPAVAKAVFENKWLQRVFHATPGIEMWSMLGKAYYHTQERQRDGQLRYDLVIVDAPATGHSLEMLAVPKVITEIAPASILKRDADKAWSLIQDEQQTALVVVALLEQLPVMEAIELDQALQHRFQLQTSLLVVNKLMVPLWSAETIAALQAIQSEPHAPLASDPMIRVANKRIQDEQNQRLLLRSLQQKIAAPCRKMEYIHSERISYQDLITLSGQLTRA